jgi:hypothetical protein
MLDQDEMIRSTFVDSVATLYYINEGDDPLGNPLLKIVQEAFMVRSASFFYGIKHLFLTYCLPFLDIA